MRARLDGMTLLTPTATFIPQWTMADRLRKAREQTGLDQTEFADRLGITRQSVGNYESGRRTPRPLYLRAWSEATGVPACWIATGETCGCEVEPPVGLEPTTCALQVGEFPDTADELFAIWAEVAR